MVSYYTSKGRRIKMAKEIKLDDEKKMGAVSGIKNILLRIVAVFAANGLVVIGAGAIIGIDTMSAIILAGTLGVATVVEKLARGFIDDGRLDIDEINAAFNSVDKKAN
jgi:hypothetical protein